MNNDTILKIYENNWKVFIETWTNYQNFNKFELNTNIKDFKKYLLKFFNSDIDKFNNDCLKWLYWKKFEIINNSILNPHKIINILNNIDKDIYNYIFENEKKSIY